MTENVLVVHGVANRDEKEFEATVKMLAVRVNEKVPSGARFNLVPAFWGDLGGGDGANLHEALPPSILTDAFGVRADTDFDGLVDHIYRTRRAIQGHSVRSEDDVARIVTEAARARTQQETKARYVTRGGGLTDSDLALAIDAAIKHSTYIRRVRDRDLLCAVGGVVGASLSSSADATIETRSIVSGIRDTVARVVDAIDTLLGSTTAEALGAFNQLVRGALATSTALSFGDIVAYRDTGNGATIRQRVLDRARHGGIDTARPLIVIAHSLGGLIVLDLLLSHDLNARRLVTCGSQPTMFHVLKQLPGTLTPYMPGYSTPLPATIEAWTNLWHPMDVLAFVASPVFALANGVAPTDVKIETPLSTILGDKFWMHSAYWMSDELVDAVVR